MFKMVSDKQSQDFLVGIVEALAEEEDVGPLELDYVLEEYIDTDSLRQLYDHGDDWEMEFDVEEHEVYLNGKGDIEVNGNNY